jgi:hypothetical protein
MHVYTARDYRETPLYFGGKGDAEAALLAIYAPDWTRQGGKRAALAREVRRGYATVTEWQHFYRLHTAGRV